MTNIINNNQMTNVLLDALHAANLAGCEGTDYSELPSKYNAQNHLYGHLSNALKLIAPEIHTAYIETGDRQYAPKSYCEYQEGDLIWALYQGEDGCDKLEGEVTSTAFYAEYQKIQVLIYDNGSEEVVWAADVEPRHTAQ